MAKSDDNDNNENKLSKACISSTVRQSLVSKLNFNAESCIQMVGQPFDQN